jgi:hypothetical protein
MEHGIIRQEINGMVYVVSDGQMHAKMDEAKKQRDNDYRLWLFSKTPQGFTEWLKEREAARKGRSA